MPPSPEHPIWCLTEITCCSIAVTSACHGVYRVRGIVIVGTVTSFAYYVLLFWARQAGYAADEQARVAVAWTPNLVFLAITLLLFRRSLSVGKHESRQ